MYNDEFAEKKLEGANAGLTNLDAARDVALSNRELHRPAKVAELEDEELSLEDAENINALANQVAAYNDIMENRQMYRQKQIEELAKLRDSLVPKKMQEQSNGKRR